MEKKLIIGSTMSDFRRLLQSGCNVVPSHSVDSGHVSQVFQGGRPEALYLLPSERLQ